MVALCPTCGAVVPNLNEIKLSPTQRKIYDYVSRRPGCSIDQIFNHVYSDRADGGPLCINTISVMIISINKRLTGQRVAASSRGPGATYRLVKTEVPANASL